MTETFDSITQLQELMNATDQADYQQLKALESSLRKLVVKKDLTEKSVEELVSLYAYAGFIKAEMARYTGSKDAKIRTAAKAVITQAGNLQKLIDEVLIHKTGKGPEYFMGEIRDAPPVDDPDEMEKRLDDWIKSGRPMPFDPSQLPKLD